MSILSRASSFEVGSGESTKSVWDLLDELDESFELSHASAQQQQQFKLLTPEKKAEALQRITVAAPKALQKLILNGVGLENTHVEQLVGILRAAKHLKKLHVERNNLGETGLIMLAEALIELGEQGTVVDLSVANQRSHLSTLAISRLLDAMEACPEMIKLGLGTLRDDGIRKRHQQITMANTEAKRIRRSSLRRSAAGGEDDATGLAPNTPWSPMSHSSSSAASSNPSSEPGSPNRPLRVKSNASSALLERMSSIEGSVAAAIDEMNTVAVDWAHEARCIAQSEAHPEPALVGARELPNAAAAAGGGGGSGGGVRRTIRSPARWRG